MKTQNFSYREVPRYRKSFLLRNMAQHFAKKEELYRRVFFLHPVGGSMWMEDEPFHPFIYAPHISSQKYLVKTNVICQSIPFMTFHTKGG